MSNPGLDHKKRQLLGFLEFCRFGKLNLPMLGMSFFLLAIASLFEGFSFGLLVPFLKQAAGIGSYEGWRNVPVLGNILTIFHFEKVVNRIDILLIAIVMAVIIRQATSYVSQVLYYKATLSYEAELRIKGYRQILTYGCSYFDAVRKGEIHNTLMRFTTEVADLMRTSFNLLRGVFFGIVYIATLVAISPGLCLTVVVVSPFFYWGTQGIFQRIHSLYTNMLNSEQMTHSQSMDVFSNIKLVKAVTRENNESESFEANERLRARHGIRAYTLYLLLTPLQEILLTLGIAVIIGLSFHFYANQNPSFFVKLIVSFLIFRRALQVVNAFISELPQAIRRIPFARELRKLLNPAEKSIALCGNRMLSKISKGIEYEKVSMNYLKGEIVLNNVSFFIPAGSFTAIVGASGAGKTTLVELLPRFYEYQSGDILIDDISIHDYDLASLRNVIGFVSQDTLVLNDTIRNNILYAHPTATDKEIVDAAQKAYVFDFADRLGAGLDTIIGDKGVKLSGGELQRLAIARVILRKPEIIILDEATSSLDSVSEQLIQKALAELTASRTTIAVAHRLSTIQHADQIIVFECGKIAEIGTSQDLIAKHGAFYQYWNAQNIQS